MRGCRCVCVAVVLRCGVGAGMRQKCHKANDTPHLVLRVVTRGLNCTATCPSLHGRDVLSCQSLLRNSISNIGKWRPWELNNTSTEINFGFLNFLTRIVKPVSTVTVREEPYGTTVDLSVSSCPLAEPQREGTLIWS